MLHLGGCQNYGPLLGPLNTRCRIILRTQKKDLDFDKHAIAPDLSNSILW